VSTGWCGDCDHPQQWVSGAGLDQTVSRLRSQLPIGADFQGVPWCAEDDSIPGYPVWTWEPPHTAEAPYTPWIEVDVSAGDPPVTVYIQTAHHSESFWGCPP
jgi:hypothetical protein